ncbi:MAG: hypothetical protein V1905_03950 [bacterium]
MRFDKDAFIKPISEYLEDFFFDPIRCIREKPNDDSLLSYLRYKLSPILVPLYVICFFGHALLVVSVCLPFIFLNSIKLNTRSYSTILVLIVLAIVGCSNISNNHDFVSVTVSDVRIVSEGKQKIENDSNAVTGAVIGGLVAGTKGAIVGAVLADGPSKVITENEITGCRFLAKIDNGPSIDFSYPYNYRFEISKCATLRRGDRLNIKRIIIRENDKIISTSYLWGDSYRLGEIIPE